jgi:signal transduction histidine kinase
MEVSWQGERRPLAADVELSAYRIITEAVTNVIRHAQTDRCQVAVSYQPGELLVGITDDGPPATPAPPGYGITGMRERAELLGGQLTAGPGLEGGFGVTARIPVPAPTSTATAPVATPGPGAATAANAGLVR